jgi:hypothetical protein
MIRTEFSQEDGNKTAHSSSVEDGEELEDFMCAVVPRYWECVIYWDFYSCCVVNPLKGNG